MTQLNENRYANGKIYKLIDNTTGMFYYGSTCLPLHKRLYIHKQNSKEEKHKSRKIYKYFTTERFLSGDVEIVLVENVCVNNKEELTRVENGYIQSNINNILCLNTNSASNLQYTLSQIQCRRKYYVNNKDTILQRNKEYRDNPLNKERINDHRQEYRNKEESKVHKKEYDKNFYEENREKRLAYALEKITCKCGSITNRAHVYRHLKSKKHQEYLNSLE